jgi:hypothetical protein
MKKIIVSFLAVMVVAIGYFIWSKHKGNGDKENQKEKTSQFIAVFPFDNMSNDPRNISAMNTAPLLLII